MNCNYRTGEGWECSAPAMHDSDRCFLHSDDPAVVEKRREAQSRGGRNAQRASQPVDIPIDLSSADAILGTLQGVAEALASGRIDRARSTALVYLASAAIQARKHLDYESRLRVIERRLKLREEDADGQT